MVYLKNVAFFMDVNLVSYTEGGNRSRVFENRVLRRIFGPKRDGVTGEWRRLHNEERYDLCSLPNIFGNEHI
jgi:hypothetical protein